MRRVPQEPNPPEKPTQCLLLWWAILAPLVALEAYGPLN